MLELLFATKNLTKNQTLLSPDCFLKTKHLQIQRDVRPSRFVFGFVSVQSLSVTANYKAECEKWCIWIITTVGLFDKILGSTNVTFIRLAERKVFYVLFLIPWVYCGEKFMKRKILHYFIVWQLSISLLLECISFLFWAELQQLDDKTFLELLQKNADNII